MKLLLVDDEQLILLGLKHIIEQMDTAFERIDMAGNAEQALAMMAQTHYDLVITDIKMPGLNGLEFIEEARRRQHFCRHVVLSGYADFEYAQAAIRNSVADYLLKPIDKQELSRMLKSIADSHRQQHTPTRDETESLLRDALYADPENAVRPLPFGEECEMLALYSKQNAPLGVALSATIPSLFPGACVQKIYTAPIWLMIGKPEQLNRAALDRMLSDQASLFAAARAARVQTAGDLRRLYRETVSACLKAAYQIDSAPRNPARRDLSFVRLAYEMALSDAMSAIVTDGRREVENPYVRRLLELVDEEFARDINLENLSHKIGLNPAYLGRVFRQCMQMSFSQYLAQYRIHKAVDAFRKHPDWTFQEVALATGFQEIRNFYRRFKEEVGITPGEFRSWLNQSE